MNGFNFSVFQHFFGTIITKSRHPDHLQNCIIIITLFFCLSAFLGSE